MSIYNNPSKPVSEEEIKLFIDGDSWCALIGNNLQEGVAGFGKTKGDALRDLADTLEPDVKRAREEWEEIVRKGAEEGDCVICGYKQ